MTVTSTGILITTQTLLGPIGLLSKYKECFDLNLCQREGEIDIDKLKRVRIRHLPAMNIVDFNDQLTIMNRIRLVITRDIEALLLSPRPSIENFKQNSSCFDTSVEQIIQEPIHKISNRREQYKLDDEATTSISSKRNNRGSKGFRRNSVDLSKALTHIQQIRRELDDEVREGKINNLRRNSLQTNNNELSLTNKQWKDNVANDIETNKGAYSMRRVSDLRIRRKSIQIPDKGMLFNHSLSEKAEQASRRERSMYYGASAQRVANTEYNLSKVGVKVLNSFKTSIPCERCSILFIDDDKGEIFFFENNMKRYSFERRRGIAGFVATNLITINIPDAYSDERFDRKLDEQTGFITRSILCAPIRNFSGKCIAVIQMLNKKGKNGSSIFNEADENRIKICSVRVSEALDMVASMHIQAQSDMDNLVLEEQSFFKLR